MGFNHRDVVRTGRKVYERHRTDLERQHPGKYVVIDTRTEKLYLGGSPEDAYRQAAAANEAGPFHLVRVGNRAAFRSRRLPNGIGTRVTR